MPFFWTARMAATVREEMVWLLWRSVPSTAEATRRMGGRAEEGEEEEKKGVEEKEAKRWVRGGEEDAESQAVLIAGRGILVVALAAARATGRRREPAVMTRKQKDRTGKRQCIRPSCGRRGGTPGTPQACVCSAG